MSRSITIAVDGYSSCGKSTMAKFLAKELNYTYVDTGAMYRAVALYALRNGYAKGNEVDSAGLENALDKIDVAFGGDGHVLLNGEDVESEIRSMQVSGCVYKVSSIAAVRAKLVEMQRKIGKNGGVVMDGRDIGTVVFPDAELKIFVTASAETRAQRRFLELRAKGDSASYEEVLDNIRKRDYADENRAVSPLRKAPDAVVLDNGNLTIDGQNKELLRLCREKGVEVNGLRG